MSKAWEYRLDLLVAAFIGGCYAGFAIVVDNLLVRAICVLVMFMAWLLGVTSWTALERLRG